MTVSLRLQLWVYSTWSARLGCRRTMCGACACPSGTPPSSPHRCWAGGSSWQGRSPRSTYFRWQCTCLRGRDENVWYLNKKKEQRIVRITVIWFAILTYAALAVWVKIDRSVGNFKFKCNRLVWQRILVNSCCTLRRWDSVKTRFHFVSNQRPLEYLRQWFSTWGRGPRGPWGPFAIFRGVVRADKNIHNCFDILYFVYGSTFCRGQNNRNTWQKWQPTFSFKIVLSVIMTIAKLWVWLWPLQYCCVGQRTNNFVT